MLEPCVNQAAGLQSLALATHPRLVAVASHGQQQGELPLLYSLCATWSDLGFSVAVLDGQAHESASNPGLLQWLDAPHNYPRECHEQGAWTIIPAADGLDRLAGQPHPHDALGNLMAHDAVVLIYANAALLTRLLKGSGLSPLLLVAPLSASALTAYQALKQLWVDAQLRPTVANISLTPAHKTPAVGNTPMQHLQDCAMNFLGCQLNPIAIRAATLDNRSQDDVHRLALQLLECAVSLQRRQCALEP